MTALRKIRYEDEFAAEIVRKPAAKLYVVETKAPVEVEAPEAGGVLKNIALFLVAPFIGLAYIIAFPLVGLAALAVMAGRVAAKFNAVKLAARILRTVAMAAAAPLVGLAYVVFFPFIALGALLWVAGKAAMVRN
jgi:hypothetical protein